MHGMLPVAEIQFADFIHPAFDQIVSEAARIRYRSNGDFGVPLVIRAPYGGGVHGALYHSQSIEAFYGHVPGLKVVVPATPYDVQGLLRAAIRDPDPVLFLEHKKTYRLIKGEVPDEPYEVPIGAADVKRDGDRTSPCVAYGLMLHLRLEAAERRLEERASRSRSSTCGRSRRSTERRSSASVRKTGKAIVVYEDNRTYGAGAEISATIAEELHVRPRRRRSCGWPGPTSPRCRSPTSARARVHAGRAVDLRAHEGAGEVLKRPLPAIAIRPLELTPTTPTRTRPRRARTRPSSRRSSRSATASFFTPKGQRRLSVEGGERP